MFATGLVDFPYATHGGTLFLINFYGRIVALTCRHVFGNFCYGQLIVTNTKNDFTHFAVPKRVLYPDNPQGHAIDSDILDVAVIEFFDDVDASFFQDSPYVLDHATSGTSSDSDVILINGALKQHSRFSQESLGLVYGFLRLRDSGAHNQDVSLRKACGYARISDITGISGSPVFNASKRVLCGMAIRGGISGSYCTIYYIDIFDIIKILETYSTGTNSQYEKKVLYPLPGKGVVRKRSKLIIPYSNGSPRS